MCLTALSFKMPTRTISLRCYLCVFFPRRVCRAPLTGTRHDDAALPRAVRALSRAAERLPHPGGAWWEELGGSGCWIQRLVQLPAPGEKPWRCCSPQGFFFPHQQQSQFVTPLSSSSSSPRLMCAMPTRLSTRTASQTSRLWSWCTMTWQIARSEFHCFFFPSPLLQISVALLTSHYKVI